MIYHPLKKLCSNRIIVDITWRVIMKFTIAFALAAILVLSSVFTASACPPCPDGMITVNVPTPPAYYGYGMDRIGVVGYECGNSYWPNEISTKVKIKDAGTYDVYGYVIRGQSSDCQANEDFFLTVAGVSGPETQDDADACADGERLEFLGTFPLASGKNVVKMTSASHCPPDTTPNSVELYKLCIAPTPPSAPEFPIPAVAALSVLAAIPAAAFITRKK